jgi:hypothetical protein
VHTARAHEVRTHAAHAPRSGQERADTPLAGRGPLHALSVVSCWFRTFGVFGNEMGDGVYFLGREVDGTGTTVKA